MIELRGLTKTYEDVRAVSDVSLDVARGEVFGLVGPNGAGKTTLLRMLVGLLSPTSGACSVDGVPVSGDLRRLRQSVGYQPERPGLYPNLTVRETLTFYARLRGLGVADVDRALHSVGLESVSDRRVRTLSGGMGQRLNIGQALLGEPPVLLLDEPTNRLDPIGAFELRELLAGYNARGTTILLSSHRLDEVQVIADRIGIMIGGKLIADGTMEELRKRLNLGSRLTVRLRDLSESAVDAARAAGATAVEVSDGVLRFTCAPERKLEILSALEATGDLLDFSSEHVSLGEVFVRYAEAASHPPHLDVGREGSQREP